MPITEPHGREPASRTLLLALIASALLAGAIAVIGMLASFHTVSTEMQPSFKGWAWTVPVTLDLSIATFSILELALLTMALPHLPARIAVYAATAATVYLNTRATDIRHDHAQLIAHAAMPAVWALYIELLRGGAATLTRRERAETEHPALALLLAPAPVLTAWRRSILASSGIPIPEPRPKMSADRGHFPDTGQRTDTDGDTGADSTDIFVSPIPQQATRRRSAAPDGDATATDADGTPSAATDQPARIGKGRGLTSRHAVLDLAQQNPELTGAQIAEQLGLSPRTVRRHLGRR